MNCLNCKQETQNGQVFCENCLAAMEGFPVNPDTVVQIPKQPAPRPARRRAVSLEETVAKQQKRIRRLVFWLILALAGFGVSGVLLLYVTGRLQWIFAFLPW